MAADGLVLPCPEFMFAGPRRLCLLRVGGGCSTPRYFCAFRGYWVDGEVWSCPVFLFCRSSKALPSADRHFCFADPRPLACGSAGAALAPRYGLVCGNKKAALTAALYRQSPFIVLRRYRSFASQGRLAVARFRAARPERSDRRSRQRQDKVMLHLADLAATYSPVS